MSRRRVLNGPDIASGLSDGAIEDEIMGTIMQVIPGPGQEFKETIEKVVKNYVSRQAHLGGMLEYNAQTALSNPDNTLVWDWNQATVEDGKPYTERTMKSILNPNQYGENIREIIILKSRFSMSPLNTGAVSETRVIPTDPTTWYQAGKIAKGPTAIEPDVLVLKFINGQWYIFIIELKIGAGQADTSKPKEHIQLMRGKRLMQYYISKYGGIIKPENIKLYFCAWMHGTKKSKVDFKKWDLVSGDQQWVAEVLQGPVPYSRVVGVEGEFIEAMLKRIEWFRTSGLGEILKKFTSKTGRYHDEWVKLGNKLQNKLKSKPLLFQAVNNLPPFAPVNLVTAKGRSNKAAGQAEGIRQAILFGSKSKNITQYTGTRLTAKVRDARRKTQIYYNEFKARYKERLRRQGQPTNLPENAFIRAFLTATPRTGTTPLARSINMMTRENIARRGDSLMRNAIVHHEKKPKNFINAKARLNAFAAKVTSSNQPRNIKNFITAIKSRVNSLRVAEPKARVERKRKSRNTPTETAIEFVKGFNTSKSVSNAQAQKIIKTLGGVRSIMASINGKGPTITNAQLRTAINASVPVQARASVRTAGVRRSYGSPASAF
jgi:hypothetical protein